MRTLRRTCATIFGWMTLASLSLYALSSTAFAHPGDPRYSRGNEFTQLSMEEWLVWDLHESIVLGILSMMVLYGLAMTKWRVKYDLAPEIDKRRTILFYSNMVLLWFTLDGPLHHLSDELLFSAHMVQHLILQLIWAPLLILSVPEWMLTPLLRPDWVKSLGRFLGRPRNAFLLYNGVLFGWHMPAAYNLALESHPWHIAEHLMFMVTAVIMWWPIYGGTRELPRPKLGWQAIYLFGHMFAMKALGMIITMSSTVIYTFYTTQPRVFGLTPLGDQRVGGLIMWLPSGLFIWLALGYVFIQWRRSGTPKQGSTGHAHLDDEDEHPDSSSLTPEYT